MNLEIKKEDKNWLRKKLQTLAESLFSASLLVDEQVQGRNQLNQQNPGSKVIPRKH
jgi:hypothetical protein